ncbi:MULTISPECIES: AEC family transporter [Methylobacterium]|uniref:Transporter n=2 Tax=Pseudomonadota TaxID=1224 RepID=A0ABQ4SPP0_9HYPH|nr:MULTISPECIES: AEC family transporter [Methylobacterium]PIU08311.1 MAG: transporter [Methylobacterium sp. CG09_land_8_20_14_0_10_71_15]PIU11595.1 MAG: transporter [Methylobacterium sp. CG08_land_8_20_14_0_20_71_15]GBU19535.1 transporter [Methylobacterium sp.]GJE05052.1 hypothetical protein AOPFMNJM_0347 [Methylobacterium jeotgali]
MTALGIILPVFGLILIGWVASVSGLISDKVSDGLSEYVFSIAVPALIVGTLSRPGLTGEIAWSYWFSYFGGAALAWAIGSLIGIRREGVGKRGAILHGFAASQSNTIFVGVPTILHAYGEEGAFPLFMLLAVHLPLMMGAATFLIEADGERSLLQRIGGLGVVLARNPIFVALAIGLAMRGFGLSLSGIPKNLVEMISASASTCALIALGAGLKRYRVLHDLPGAGVVAGLKLVLHPLAVWVLAFHVFTMPAAYAGVAVLFAAMPVGVNAYLLANRYKSETGLVSAAVLISTLFAALTTTAWLFVLGRA